MQAEFICQRCKGRQNQEIKNHGLFKRNCFHCDWIYLDCINLQECIDYCDALDKAIDIYISNCVNCKGISMDCGNRIGCETVTVKDL